MNSNHAKNIADKLDKCENIKVEFERAQYCIARYLLADVITTDTTYNQPKWPELLSWASFYAQSSNETHVELALIASIAALLLTDNSIPEIRQSARFILESFSNTPTLELARTKGLFDKQEQVNKLALILQNYRRQLKHIIFDKLSSKNIRVTDFQDKIWDMLENDDNIALSAPTSAGKSYILLHWIPNVIIDNNINNIIYIVPSRALINQISSSLLNILANEDYCIRIVSLPTLYLPEENRKSILVMTQERVERIITKLEDFTASIVVVDEAQKLGEGPRGVILQRVLDDLRWKNPNIKIVMAAPHAVNAGELLPSRSIECDKSESPVLVDAKPTVLQNLYWINQKPRRRSTWEVFLIQNGNPNKLGDIEIEKGLTSKRRKYAALVTALGKDSGGNIVFANGPGEAERIALLICDLIEVQSTNVEIDQEVLDLALLVRDHIHPSYPLAISLRQGVGIHYGDMPEIARREQERLFNEGKLPFIVCTSTLLEGVNLPCRNLFIWGPRQGKSTPMSQHAFWNLAGRAGRWGREFAGSIFCFDVFNDRDWPTGPPRRRTAFTINHSGSELLIQIPKFDEFVNSKDPLKVTIQNRYFEQIFGELVATKLSDKSLKDIGWIKLANNNQLSQLEEIVDNSLQFIDAPTDLLIRHRGINPILISRFYKYLLNSSNINPESLVPMSPEMQYAKTVLSDNLLLIEEHLASDIRSEKMIKMVSNLTIDWMRGISLGKILKNRLDYLKGKNKLENIPQEIRFIIRSINKYSRYLIPKYISCYSDIVSNWFKKINRTDLVNEVADLQDMLESGVTDQTMISLIGLGLSRMSAIELAERIPEANLSVQKVVSWIQKRDLTPYGISPVMIREINNAIKNARYR